MKKKHWVILVLAVSLIVLLFLIGSIENNKDSFKVRKMTENSEEYLSVEDRFNVSYFDSAELEIHIPTDFTKWKESDEEYLYEDPEIRMDDGKINYCTSYITYDKKNEFYTLVIETGIKKNNNSGYKISSTQIIDPDSLNIRFDDLDIEKY